MKVPFSPPDISELEINEVAEALRSGWITTGPRTKQLEKEIAEWIGVINAYALIRRRLARKWRYIFSASGGAMK